MFSVSISFESHFPLEFEYASIFLFTCWECVKRCIPRLDACFAKRNHTSYYISLYNFDVVSAFQKTCINPDYEILFNSNEMYNICKIQKFMKTENIFLNGTKRVNYEWL